jgi:outer membrane protein
MIKLKYLALILFIFSFGIVKAQSKIGYIDSKKIIESMQESRDAKTRLDKLVQDWQTDLTRQQDSLKVLKEDFDKKKLILTEQLKTEMETGIKTLENNITDFKVKKFGENGEYYRMQIEFMKPVNDRVFKAIENIAKRENFDYIFDRNSDILLLYANDKYDLTERVIAEVKKY